MSAVNFNNELSVRPLTTELQQTAKKELNEVSTRTEEDIQRIRAWLLQQPHLRTRTDDQWILTFLRGCKFSLQKTKEKLEQFYTMRSYIPEFYVNRDPFLPEIQEVLKLGICLPLSQKNRLAEPRIILLRCRGDAVKIPFVHIIKGILMITDILLNEDDNFIIAGQIGMVDLEEMHINHMLHVDLNFCRKAIICLQKAYPTRPKGFHVINTPSFSETFFNVVLPVLSEKLKKRIFIYSGKKVSELHQTIPSTILPKEYGGSGDSVSKLTDIWKKKVESYRDWFLEEEKYVLDKSKQPVRCKTSSDLFGIEGSFKQLEID